jgi:hypothetical protein
VVEHPGAGQLASWLRTVLSSPRTKGRTEIRIPLVFDPWRAAILLVAGDKSRQRSKWYRTAIPSAERLYDDYLAGRRKETGQ